MPSSSQNAGFAKLYSEHQNWLFNWLCKKLGCPHEAADTAQDTFFRLLSFSALAQLREPRAFLTTTASRLMIDAARRRKIEQKYLEAWHYHHGEFADAPSAEELAIISESLLLIAQMLEGLPFKCRQAFLMNRLDDMKHSEIAEHLGVSISSVKKYIATALLHCHGLVRSGFAAGEL